MSLKYYTQTEIGRMIGCNALMVGKALRVLELKQGRSGKNEPTQIAIKNQFVVQETRFFQDRHGFTVPYISNLWSEHLIPEIQEVLKKIKESKMGVRFKNSQCSITKVPLRKLKNNCFSF